MTSIKWQILSDILDSVVARSYVSYTGGSRFE